MVRVGLVGCGTIGTRLALAIQREYPRRARITALHDRHRAHAVALQHQLAPRPGIFSFSELLRRTDIVVEAASAAIAGSVAVRALQRHRQVLVMSVGGLLGDRRWEFAARRSRGMLYIPSGALAGLDGVNALAVGRILRARLTTRKPPRALADAPYVRRRGLRLDRLTRPTTILDGLPQAAIKAFPQNTNVAAALALATRRSRRVRVRVIADPAATRNVHELDVEGDCGRIQCRIESRPSRNPKTSELAVRSAIATMRMLVDRVVV